MVFVLIETLWNVKNVTLPALTPAAFGINRNIVECKVVPHTPIMTPSTVLIETLWNVKLSAILDSSSSILVLIETLWNVKFFFCLLVSDSGYRINRNIVECKVWFIPELLCELIVLIETLWNVKIIRPTHERD